MPWAVSAATATCIKWSRMLLLTAGKDQTLPIALCGRQAVTRRHWRTGAHKRLLPKRCSILLSYACLGITGHALFSGLSATETPFQSPARAPRLCAIGRMALQKSIHAGSVGLPYAGSQMKL